MNEIWIVLLVVMAAGLIQGLTGFGFGLFSVGLLILFMPIADAVVIAAVMSLASSLLNMWSLRKELDWRDSRPLILAALPSTWAGIYLLKNLSPDLLQIGIVLMILGGCAASLMSPHRAVIKRDLPWAYIAGFIGGLFGGALNMGGPPAVLYALLRGWDKSRSKGLMVTYFVVTGLVRVGLFALTDVASIQAWQLSVLALMPGLLAAYGGVLLFRRLSTQMFRYAAMAILVGIAAKILIS